MNVLQTIRLSCKWDEEDQCFELSSSTPVSSWASTLFAWHEETFYGTLLDIDHDGENGTVRLSPWQALTLFALRPHSRFSAIEWADEFTARLEEWAKHIWNGLRERRFLPDASLWKSTGGTWSEAGRTRWRGADDDPDPFVATWRSLAIADWLSRDPELRGIWGEIVRAYPLIASPSGQWTGTEDDWLEQIGWLGDRPPFTVGLRLVEPPEDGDVWTLEAVLIAIDDSVITPASDIPRVWRPYEPSIQRAIRRICAIVPWLGNGSESLLHELSDEQAWRFLSEDSLKLTEAGVRLLLPDWWHDIRQAQLSIKAKLSPSVNAESLFGLERLADFDWRVATNGIELTEEEFAALAEQKRRLIRLRGQWLILDPALVRRAQALMENGVKRKECRSTTSWRKRCFQKQRSAKRQRTNRSRSTSMSMINSGRSSASSNNWMDCRKRMCRRRFAARSAHISSAASTGSSFCADLALAPAWPMTWGLAKRCNCSPIWRM